MQSICTETIPQRVYICLQDEAATCGAATRSGGDEQVGGLEATREREGEERKEAVLLEELRQEIRRLGRTVSLFA